MSATEDLWIPLVDEPIGLIVESIVTADPELAALIGTPRRVLPFRTFAYIRVGMLLGQLLVESDDPPTAPGEDWIETLLASPANRASVEAVVRQVAEQVARETDGDPVPIGPDDETRARFLEFARKRLG